MNRTRTIATAGVVLAGIVAGGVAFAQTPASLPATTPAPAASAPISTSAPISSKPSTATRVETWTKKQWNAAQKELAKDKVKWADCRNQSKAQKLSGQKSWLFLYQCMKG